MSDRRQVAIVREGVQKNARVTAHLLCTDAQAAGLRKAVHAIIAAAAPLAPDFPDSPLLRDGRHIINRLNEIGRHASLGERADGVCRELALGGVRAPRRRVLEVLRNVDAEDGKAASPGTVRDHVPMRVTNRVLSLLQWRDYRTPAAGRPVKAFLDDLTDEEVASIVAGMKEVAELGFKAARHLRGDVYEVRADAATRSFRVLVAVEGRHGQVLLSLSAFEKRTQKTPSREADAGHS